MITPLSGRDLLDVAGLERLVEHIVAGGASGLFILGTTGEGPSLSYRLRREVISRVVRLVAGRVPVLVAITDTAFTESVTLANHAAEAGAQAVVLSAPPYYPSSQQDLLRYVRHLAEAVPLPLFLYNMPSHTKLAFEPDTVRQLMEIPKIIGLKDSSADMGYFQQIRQLKVSRPDFALLIGPEELLAEAILQGADGGVCGGANLCCRLYVDLYCAAISDDLDRLAELHARVIQLSEAIYGVDQYGQGVIKGLKCALSWMGICRDHCVEPLQSHGNVERALIRRGLHELALLPQSLASSTTSN
jgi:dihydrodipicolinate synthase/N-acetylneuraminate lyase